MEREIIHRCGHAQRHHVPGYFVADQDRAAIRLARKACAVCDREAARAAAPPLATVLPALSGSPRQVAWAERIRHQRLAVLARVDPAIAGRVAAVIDARWWIDHRGDDLRVAAG